MWTQDGQAPNVPNDNSDVGNETSANTDNSQSENSNTNTKGSQVPNEKHVTKVHTAYRNALKDDNSLVELYESDKKIAHDVMNQLFQDDYIDTDDYASVIDRIRDSRSDLGDDSSNTTGIDKETLSKEIKAEILAWQQEEKANQTIDKALKGFSDEDKESIMEDFKETLWKRKLTPAFADRQIQKSILFHQRDEMKTNRRDAAMSNAASNPLRKSAWGSSKKTTMNRDKLDQMGMSLALQKVRYPELFPKKQ